MGQIDSFLNRCDIVAGKLGIARATLSTKLFNDGDRIREISEGKDVGVRRLLRAERVLADIERNADAKAAA